MFKFFAPNLNDCYELEGPFIQNADECEADTFGLVIHWIYYRKLTTTKSKILEVYKLADYLSVDGNLTVYFK